MNRRVQTQSSITQSSICNRQSANQQSPINQSAICSLQSTMNDIVIWRSCLVQHAPGVRRRQCSRPCPTLRPFRQQPHRAVPILGIIVVLAVRGGSAQSLPAPAQAPSVPLTLEAALQRALEANPSIVAARLRTDIARNAVGVARERPNPELRAEFEKETPTRAYGVILPLEIGGKRTNRIAVSQAGVLTSEAEVTQVVLDVRTAVRRAYFNRVIAEARLTVLGELRDLATRTRDAARDRFTAGAAPRLELLQAELGLAEVENELTAAGGTAAGARAELNALLAYPLDAAVPLSSSLDPAALPAIDVVEARAQAANAELAVLDRRLEEQRARVALARSEQVPDLVPEFTLTRGAEPEFNTGWRAAVGVAVPVFTRHRAGVLVEEATLAQLASEREALTARIRGEVASAFARADAQRQQYLRYRDQILPQALEVERMAEDSYRLGQTGIAAFLQALQSTRDARLRALQTASDFQAALADLEHAIGDRLR
jgi:outer membrane protein, heavy metal efflux system